MFGRGQTFFFCFFICRALSFLGVVEKRLWFLNESCLASPRKRKYATFLFFLFFLSRGTSQHSDIPQLL